MALQGLKEEISKRIDQQTWLDPVADTVDNAVTSTWKSAGQAGKQAEDFLNGTWLGHPLHPVITDVPIGSFTAALLLDGLEASTGRRGYGRASDALLGLGIASGVLAALSGLSDWQHTVGKPRRVGILHALLNTASLVFYGFSLAARLGGSRSTGRALTAAGYTFSVAAAYLGGDLVYEHRIGVNHAPEQPLSPAYVEVMSEDELGYDRMVRKDVQGVAVLFVRRGERVYAIAETCSHLGGPLADGELRDDDSVVCPWHGSRFDLATGMPLEGPTAFAQPCYQARIRDRRVEVRQPQQMEIDAENG